ncbi:alpha/beta fold hydrolase [Sphaerisporangium sp. TRM90804]|uniref:alpha/beta hydrolase n=1 Tax=Sphaerisporangium sp. TRM90804 TaxID=3031113 RepID=UPI0024488510|nr:alpha/beta fold hydrolase [Sphaerisporangium sp. TRM90804]MDH2424542.1 alpha/beta fold hydrolase [Sphaerisporangium sp. TRM90804]
MPLMPGSEPYQHEGGPIGVLLCHGFTGSPQSLRPWGEHLAAAGLTVSLPRLPGHGTTWQEMNRTRWEDWYAELERAFEGLRSRCQEVFVMGLSLGGCMALRLAEVHGTSVRGAVVVNPSIVNDVPILKLAPVLKFLIASVPGVANDIKREGVTELGYTRTPVRAAATLPKLWSLVQSELHLITQPVLVYHSAEDHVVKPASVELMRRSLGDNLTVRECLDSYHVATLDNDAPAIFEGSLDFIRTHASVPLQRD